MAVCGKPFRQYVNVLVFPPTMMLVAVISNILFNLFEVLNIYGFYGLTVF